MSSSDDGCQYKRELMAQVARQVRDLERSPLYEYRQENGYEPVVGEGNVCSAVMFIGEAPGEQEAKTGRPFVGSAGQVLDRLLQSVGIEREDVYITNVVKDRPPGNRDPTAEEINLYSPFLWRQVEILEPRVIVTLGRFAMDFVLKHLQMAEQGSKISDLHGTLLKARASYGQVIVLPLYHPAVVFYRPGREQVLKRDFQALEEYVELRARQRTAGCCAER
ncbi:MAG: uracil-DNA glycosylase family protein [Anaerolineae bacterium]